MSVTDIENKACKSAFDTDTYPLWIKKIFPNPTNDDFVRITDNLILISLFSYKFRLWEIEKSNKLYIQYQKYLESPSCIASRSSNQYNFYCNQYYSELKKEIDKEFEPMRPIQEQYSDEYLKKLHFTWKRTEFFAKLFCQETFCEMKDFDIFQILILIGGTPKIHKNGNVGVDSYVDLPNGPRIYINPKTRSYIRSILKTASERNITTFDGLLKFRTDRMKQPESTLLRKNDIQRYVDSLIEKNQGLIDISSLKFYISTETGEEKLKNFIGEIATKFMESMYTAKHLLTLLSGNVSPFSSSKNFDGFKIYYLDGEKLYKAMSQNNISDIEKSTLISGIVKKTHEFSQNTVNKTQTDDKTLKVKRDINIGTFEEKIKFIQSKFPQLTFENILRELSEHRETCINTELIPEDMIANLQTAVFEQHTSCPDNLSILINQERIAIFANTPAIYLFKQIVGQDFNILETSPIILFLLWLNALASMTPNEAEVTINETLYQKTLVSLQTKFIDSFIGAKEDSQEWRLILIFGVCIRNTKALEKLESYPVILAEIFKTSCRIYHLVSLAQNLSFMTKLEMNKLFWVNGGSPDNFNAFWPLATTAYKLIQYLLKYFPNKDSTGITYPLEYGAICKFSVEQLSHIFGGIYGTNLRVVINSVKWMPEDYTICLCCKPETPMKMYFPWNQLIFGHLSVETTEKLRSTIMGLSPSMFTYNSTSKEVFLQQMLAKFGFTVGVLQKAFSSSAAKQQNFDVFVKTGIAEIASSKNNADPFYGILRNILFGY